MNTIFISVMLFSPAQLTAIILLSVFVLGLIALNVWLIMVYRSRGERKLCTRQLQSKRDELLARLNGLKSGAPITPYSYGDGGDDDEEEDEQVSVNSAGETSDAMLVADILAVASLSEQARARLGFASRVYDDRQYYVRYAYSFEAKLRSSDDEVKRLYKALYRELRLYKGIKIKDTFNRQRIYRGRKTLGVITFRGKNLYVAFDLDPADYAGTEYAGEDRTGSRRFGKTPLGYRLSDERELEIVKYMLVQLADANTIVMEEKPLGTRCEIDKLTVDEMYMRNIVRITVLGEVPGTNPRLGLVDEEEPEKQQYNRSFEARIMQSNDALKARYSELKNYIMSYGDMTDNKTWQRETFRIGRSAVAAFTVRGKTLCLYLATDPVRFMGTKYKVTDASKNKKNKSLPLMFRIKSDRSTMYAKQLLDFLFKEMNVEKNDRKPVDYTMPYKATENLVRRGLIRVKNQPSRPADEIKPAIEVNSAIPETPTEAASETASEAATAQDPTVEVPETYIAEPVSEAAATEDTSDKK